MTSMKVRTLKQTEELNRYGVKLYRCAVCEMSRQEAEALITGYFCSKKCEREWKAYLKLKQGEMRELEEKRREAIRGEGNQGV